LGFCEDTNKVNSIFICDFIFTLYALPSQMESKSRNGHMGKEKKHKKKAVVLKVVGFGSLLDHESRYF
jgi:hypothetical protein